MEHTQGSVRAAWELCRNADPSFDESPDREDRLSAVAEIIDRQTGMPELLAALEEMLKAHEQLMPGIAHIALQDYANINQAPIRARAAIHNTKSE